MLFCFVFKKKISVGANYSFMEEHLKFYFILLIFFVITLACLQIRKFHCLANLIKKKYVLMHEVIVGNYCEECT